MKSVFFLLGLCSLALLLFGCSVPESHTACGNGVCEPGEMYELCPSDCPLQSPSTPADSAPVNNAKQDVSLPGGEYSPVEPTGAYVEEGFGGEEPVAEGLGSETTVQSEAEAGAEEQEWGQEGQKDDYSEETGLVPAPESSKDYVFPVADAGADRTVSLGSRVILQGNTRFNSANEVRHAWYEVDPETYAVLGAVCPLREASSPSLVKCSFTAGEKGVHMYKLGLIDANPPEGKMQWILDFVTITVE